MGTNYYIRTAPCGNACEHCDATMRVHLGKSSAGWRFGHYAPADWPRDRAHEMWLEQIDVHLLNGGHIEDEYGATITKQELLDLIEAKQHLRSHLSPRPDERAAWASRNMTDLFDSLMKTHFLSGGYDFSDREFS